MKRDVMCFVGNRCLNGSLAINGKRVLDTLLDTGSEYLRLRNVVASARTTATTPRMPEVVVSKHRLGLVLLPGETHEAPQKRSLCQREMQTCSAFAVVDGCLVWGKLHLPPYLVASRSDPLATLTRHLGEFFALTEVRLFTAADGAFAVPVAFANRSRVDAFSVGTDLRPPAASDGDDPAIAELQAAVDGLREAVQPLVRAESAADTAPEPSARP